MASETPQASNPWPRLIAGVVAGAILLFLGLTQFKETDPSILEGIDFNFGKTLVQIGVVLILFPLIYQIFVKPLSAAIQERNAELARTFTEAEQLRSRMEQMRSEYEARLVETEASAREQIQAQIREAQALRQQLMAEAAAKADELVKKAQQDIEQEKNRVMTELRLEVVNLTLTATERVLGENVDTERNRKLVTEFIDKVEVPS
jgi:F-type H+-transporting ATPase subunit b